MEQRDRKNKDRRPGTKSEPCSPCDQMPKNPPYGNSIRTITAFSPKKITVINPVDSLSFPELDLLNVLGTLHL